MVMKAWYMHGIQKRKKYIVQKHASDIVVNVANMPWCCGLENKSRIRGLEPPEGNKGKDDCIISCLLELHSIIFIDFLLQIIG